MSRENYYLEPFEKIGAALRADLLGRGVDAVEEWHGGADQAVVEHVAELTQAAGASVLFGYDPEPVEQRDAAQQPAQIAIGVFVAVLVARGNDRQADNRTMWQLYRRVEDALSAYRSDRRPAFYGCQNVVYMGPGIAEVFADYMYVSGRWALLKAFDPYDA